MKSGDATPQPDLQWGIVGPGTIARKFARDLRVATGGRLRAVASRKLHRARAFADEFGAELAFDNIQALADDTSVDIVYISTPHNAHFAAAKLLLESGKPVLCEKPLTVNARQARELIAVSRFKGVFLMEAMWTRCLPVYAQIRRWLNDGLIGRPRNVFSGFCIHAQRNPANRWYNPALAGGALLDLGVYNLAVSQLVMGRQPEQVTATAKLAVTGVDELLAATLRYAHGGVAQFVCGLSSTFDNSLVIGGDKGFIRVPANFIHGTEATLTVEEFTEGFSMQQRGEGFEYEIEEAMRCLRIGTIESPLMPHADTLATMEAMDEIRRQIGLLYPDEQL